MCSGAQTRLNIPRPVLPNHGALGGVKVISLRQITTHVLLVQSPARNPPLQPPGPGQCVAVQGAGLSGEEIALVTTQTCGCLHARSIYDGIILTL